MNFGYYRTGSLQVPGEEELKNKILEAVEEKRFIFYDERFSTETQEQYHLLLRLLRKEDCLYLDRLDSLGYTYPQIAEQWRMITEEIGADIIVLDSNGYLDSRQMHPNQEEGTSAQTCFLFLLGYLHDMQQNWMQRNQESKKKQGRPRKAMNEMLFHETAMRWQKKEINVEEACEIVGCTKTTWYKYAKERGYYLKSTKNDLP